LLPTEPKLVLVMGGTFRNDFPRGGRG